MITTLAGTNHFMLQQELQRRVGVFVAEHGDLALEKLDGEEVNFERISESLQSLPFLASKKMVVLKKPSACKQFTEHIEQTLDSVPDTTDVIIVEPKPDKRSIYYKTLTKKTQCKEFPELSEDELVRWLVMAAKDQGGSLNKTDATYLIQRLGTDQSLLAHELAKLLDYQSDINRQTIDLLTEPVPQSTIFELLGAAFAGDKKRTLKLYDEQRRQKVEPPVILAMVAWQLHVLAIVKMAGTRSPATVASEAKLSPFVVNRSKALAQTLSLKRLKELVALALDTDIRLKSQAIDADEALTYLLLRCAED